MSLIQSLIREEVNRKQFPAPKGTEAFPAYAIASAKELLQEMKCAARSTLEYPMTFETLGKGLRFFKGRALRDLADYRKRCTDNMVTCLNSYPYLDVQPQGLRAFGLVVQKLCLLLFCWRYASEVVPFPSG
jgi:hypothetical protein